MNKIFGVLTVLVLSVQLFSCNAEKQKNAYCFSIVFERQNRIPTVTLYCKTADSDSDNNQKLENISFVFQSDTFEKALKKASECEYSFYYNSAKAIFVSSNVSKSDIKNIAVTLFDNTKYQTSAEVLELNDVEKGESELLHSEAQKVCNDEKVEKSNAKYVKAVEYFADKLK